MKELVDRPLAVTRRAFTELEVKTLIEQALREQTGADFAFMNAGSIRDSLPKGQLLERHIWNIMPFDNATLVGTFKGKDLPAVVLGGRTVDPERDYTLVVSDFTAQNQGTAENLGTTGLKFPQRDRANARLDPRLVPKEKGHRVAPPRKGGMWFSGHSPWLAGEVRRTPGGAQTHAHCAMPILMAPLPLKQKHCEVFRFAAGQQSPASSPTQTGQLSHLRRSQLAAASRCENGAGLMR
ncbi:MAG: 5'-nucleotidase [Ignavibacteriota bacterium]